MPEKIISILDPLMNIDDHILTAPGDETFDEWNLKWALMTWVDKVRILVQEQHDEIEKLKDMNSRDLELWASAERVSVKLVEEVKDLGRLPVVNFAAGGIATPADASLMMQLGCDGVFVGSGIFKSSNPAARAKAIVEATMHYQSPEVLVRCSHGLGDCMESLEISKLENKFAERGW